MTNKERQQKRFERDRKKRLEKRIAKEKELCSYEKFISTDELFRCFYKCKKGVSWKRSIQSFEKNLFKNVLDIHNQLEKCNNISKGYVEFQINERGKTRKIQACHISERIVQKSFAENILSPILEDTFIKNNCASQKGKGIHKVWDYFEEELRSSYKKWGQDFYIVQGDFHNYFASIPHDKLIEKLDKYFFDERIRWYYRSVINSFYEDDKCIGLGLGSQICQNFAIFYPNILDHKMKQLGKYGRFNDDFYLIVRTKEEAKKAISKIYDIANDLELEINEKKTHIVKATHSITYLKTKFNLFENGKIIRRPCRKAIVRERRKLKKMKNKLDNGEISFQDIECSYIAWKGSFKGKQSYISIKNMNKLFNKLFIEEWRYMV